MRWVERSLRERMRRIFMRIVRVHIVAAANVTMQRSTRGTRPPRSIGYLSGSYNTFVLVWFPRCALHIYIERIGALIREAKSKTHLRLDDWRRADPGASSPAESSPGTWSEGR